MKQKKS